FFHGCAVGCIPCKAMRGMLPLINFLWIHSICPHHLCYQLVAGDLEHFLACCQCRGTSIEQVRNWIHFYGFLLFIVGAGNSTRNGVPFYWACSAPIGPATTSRSRSSSYCLFDIPSSSESTHWVSAPRVGAGIVGCRGLDPKSNTLP